MTLASAAAELLRDILSRELTTANDVVSLILTGETLRRVVWHDADEESLSSQLLVEYERVLTEHAALIPDDLDGDLGAALTTLRHVSEDATVAGPDDVLRAVDEVLMVAAAAHRTGRLQRSALDALAKRAFDASRDVAVEAEPLWSEANDRAGRIGTDPEFPHLTEWLEPLAEFAPARVAASVAATRGTLAERSTRAIDAVIALKSTRAAARERTSNVTVLEFRRKRPTILAVAAADSEPTWDDATGTEVHCSEGLSVRVREIEARGGSAAAIRIVADQAAGMDFRAVDAVTVTSGGQHVRGHVERTRLYWLGFFDVEGETEVLVGSHRIAFIVRRPEGP